MVFRVCRHIKTNGLQCQSPALRDDKFCYFHTTLRRLHRPVAAKSDVSTVRPTYDARGNFDGMEPMPAPAADACIDLGLLEDTASVQVAISTVVNALANNRLELRRATALLYGLQLASSNCRSMPTHYSDDREKMLRETMGGANGEPIANPGLNTDETWAYPDDPGELYDEEQEELRVDALGEKDEEDSDAVAEPGQGDASPARTTLRRPNSAEGKPVYVDPWADLDKDDDDEDGDEDEDDDEDGDGDDDDEDEDGEGDQRDQKRNLSEYGPTLGGDSQNGPGPEAYADDEAEAMRATVRARVLAAFCAEPDLFGKGSPTSRKSHLLKTLPVTPMQPGTCDTATADVVLNEELSINGQGMGGALRVPFRVSRGAERAIGWLRAASAAVRAAALKPVNRLRVEASHVRKVAAAPRLVIAKLRRTRRISHVMLSRNAMS